MTQEKQANTSSTNLHLDSQFVPFDQIPGSSQLYLDYLYHFDQVRKFYAPKDVSDLTTAAEHLAAVDFDRQTLTEVLADQNRRLGSSPESMANIERLADPKTLAVVTGQQAGLFTGPEYTVFKALAAVKLSRQLNERGFTTVPVFWIESEDHDHAEVSHCGLVDRQGQWREMIYPVEGGNDGLPVGRIEMTSAITTAIDELVATLPTSEFVPQIEQDLRDAYSPGVMLAEGFGRLLARLLKGTGLVLFDPMDRRLKQRLSGLCAAVIRNASGIAETLRTRSQELVAAGYHAQIHVPPDYVPLFIEEDGRRVGLNHDGRSFGLKSGIGSYSTEDLLATAHESPERFSPGVALRPVVQDALLPTLTYIGGPSEIAYFAQLNPLYSLIGRLPTPVWPRASLTIVERRSAKVLDKYKLEFRDLFSGSDTIIRRVVEQSLAADTTRLFESAEDVFRAQFAQLREALSRIDPTLTQATNTAQEKALYQLQSLRTRFTQAHAKSEEVALQQLHGLFRVLSPDGLLQERRLNIFHFLARYGLGMLGDLLAAMDVWQPDHQLISIK